MRNRSLRLRMARACQLGPFWPIWFAVRRQQVSPEIASCHGASSHVIAFHVLSFFKFVLDAGGLFLLFEDLM